MSRELLRTLLNNFDDFFSYKVKEGTEVSSLNFRVIQTEYGISFDQTNHIIKSILEIYFDNGDTVKYESSPFPLDSKFEYELFVALTMTDVELNQAENNTKENIVTEQEPFDIQLFSRYQSCRNAFIGAVFHVGKHYTN